MNLQSISVSTTPLAPNSNAEVFSKNKRPYAEFEELDQKITNIASKSGEEGNSAEPLQKKRRLTIERNAFLLSAFPLTLAFSGLPFTTIFCLNKQASPVFKRAFFFQIFESWQKLSQPSPLLKKIIEQAELKYSAYIDNAKVDIPWNKRVEFVIQKIARKAKAIDGGVNQLQKTRASYGNIYASARLNQLCKWIENKKNSDLAVFFKALPTPSTAIVDPSYEKLIDQLETLPLQKQAGPIKEWMSQNPEVLNEITAIWLENEDLTSLCSQIRYFTQIQTLIIRDSCLTNLPQKLKELNQLTKIDLTSNGLKEIPPVIFQITQLKELDLEKNQLTAISQQIGNLQKLKKLNLTSNHLKELPETLENLVQITDLQLRNNLLTRIPRIKNLKKLTRVSFHVKFEGSPELLEKQKQTFLDLVNSFFFRGPIKIELNLEEGDASKRSGYFQLSDVPFED